MVLFLSRDEATLEERVSVRRSVRDAFGHAFAFRPTRSDICRVYGLVSSQSVAILRELGHVVPIVQRPVQYSIVYIHVYRDFGKKVDRCTD